LLECAAEDEHTVTVGARMIRGIKQSYAFILTPSGVCSCNGFRATRPISRVDDRLSSGKGEIEDRVLGNGNGNVAIEIEGEKERDMGI
jgi:hypothetical protein